MQGIVDEFQRSLGNQRDSLIQISMKFDEPESPRSLVESEDMTEIQSPCHPWEPIKVYDSWTNPVHCLLCGERFALS